MHIVTIISQHRRDFVAEYKCEHCGTSIKGNGYDDDHFHKAVIPKMICGNCGKTADESYVPKETKYNADKVV